MINMIPPLPHGAGVRARPLTFLAEARCLPRASALVPPEARRCGAVGRVRTARWRTVALRAP
ncbi:hypothetical protein PLANTIT3_50180 [Plantibacter sp. T3]|nr:hypothetical protein PLANTIT3_50180 [Plantibacter sp. T3]